MKNLGQVIDDLDIARKKDVTGGGTATDVQVDSVSQVVNGTANLKTKNGDYNETTNKFVTENDIANTVIHDDTVTTASETTFADNYYTKTQSDNKYVTQTGFAERYLYYGELAHNATYTFGNTLTATISIQDAGNSITGTTHGRPVLIAGKIFGKFTNMYNATIFITVDNTDYTLVWTNNTTESVFPFFRIINLAAGVHTFTFKVNGNQPNNTQTLEITNWDADDFTICEL